MVPAYPIRAPRFSISSFHCHCSRDRWWNYQTSALLGSWVGSIGRHFYFRVWLGGMAVCEVSIDSSYGRPPGNPANHAFTAIPVGSCHLLPLTGIWTIEIRYSFRGCWSFGGHGIIDGNNFYCDLSDGTSGDRAS